MRVYQPRARIAFAIAGLIAFLPAALLATWMAADHLSWSSVLGAISCWLAVMVCGRISLTGKSFRFLEVRHTPSGWVHNSDPDATRSNDQL